MKFDLHVWVSFFSREQLVMNYLLLSLYLIYYLSFCLSNFTQTCFIARQVYTKHWWIASRVAITYDYNCNYGLDSEWRDKISSAHMLIESAFWQCFALSTGVYHFRKEKFTLIKSSRMKLTAIYLSAIGFGKKSTLRIMGIYNKILRLNNQSSSSFSWYWFDLFSAQ